jgi:hypothetical protein
MSSLSNCPNVLNSVRFYIYELTEMKTYNHIYKRIGTPEWNVCLSSLYYEIDKLKGPEKMNYTQIYSQFRFLS